MVSQSYGRDHYQSHIVSDYSKLKEQPNEKAHKIAVIANIHCLLKIIHYLLVNDK